MEGRSRIHVGAFAKPLVLILGRCYAKPLSAAQADSSAALLSHYGFDLTTGRPAKRCEQVRSSYRIGQSILAIIQDR